VRGLVWSVLLPVVAVKRKPFDAPGGARGSTNPTADTARHTFASPMVAAGVNAKALSSYLGHSRSRSRSTVSHLMPGNEAEAAELLAAYLHAQRKRAEEAARKATVAFSR
jgi:integrase